MRDVRLQPAALLFFAASVAFGQDPQALLSQPSVGLVFDSKAGALRRIEGNPGAATLGGEIPGGGQLVIAAVLAGTASAVGVDAESGSVVLISGGVRQDLAGAIPGPVAIRAGAGGRSAALFYKDGTAQVFAGLPALPERHWQLHIADTALAPDIVAGLSADGNELVIASGESLRYWRRTGERWEVVLGSPVRFASFAGNGRALAAGAGGSLWAVQDGEARLIAQNDGPLVAAAWVGGRIGLVGEDGAIALAREDGERLGEWNCGCRPASLEAVNGKSVFRLTGPDAGTVWMLDMGETPRLFFAAVRTVVEPAGVAQ
jgi:hypothetical protein